jgi:SAM-dependent methyltransferase
MGKQSRRKRERPPGEAKAHRYLARVGLPEHPDPSAYRRLAAADPEWIRQVREADDTIVALVESPDAAPDAILAANEARYPLLYRDLDTALAEYASRPVMIAAAWLRWWFEHHPPAARLLDVGCGPGILTCAYGLALPHAEVVGIDAVPEAVACAEELAGRLGAGNVSFVVGDYLDPANDTALGGAGSFDQLVGVAALADAGLYPLTPPSGPSSIADVDGAGLDFRSPGIERLVGLAAPGAAVLTLERTPDAGQAVRLGAALVHAGVELDLRRNGSGVEVFIEEGRATTFTRFAGRRSLGAESPAQENLAGLAAWLKQAPAPAYGSTWHDELRFEALKAAGAKLAWGAEIDYSPVSPTVERREIWEHGKEIYGWITTTVGYRELVTGRTVETLWNDYGGYAGQFVARGLNVRFYER